MSKCAEVSCLFEGNEERRGSASAGVEMANALVEARQAKGSHQNALLVQHVWQWQ